TPINASRSPVVQMPEVMEFLFQPSRYKVAYGGRGGVKSWSFARALLLMGAQNRLRILCAREFQNSIKDSVHQLLQDQILLMRLQDYYQVFQTEIRGITGTEFFFAGLKQNVNKVKSMEGIDICWVEEAEKVSENSWEVLIPTIRKEGSEIWVSFNPHQETDPTYKRFKTNTPPEYTPGGKRYCYIVETGWKDNPWLPEELQMEKDYLARVDKDAYDHVWGGQAQKKSNSQVMHGKCVLDAFVPDLTLCDCGHRIDKHSTPSGEVIPCQGCGCKEFEPAWKGPYYGADWGFSSDPVVLIKKWIYGRKLYVEEEFWKVGVELDQLPAAFDTVSGAKEHTIRADNSRPETISYLKNHKENSYPRIISAEKWPGSVEDGISYLRSFEQIVIHPRCVHTDEESRTYKHKIDSLTGDVLPDIIDKNNHCWDSIRYGLEPLIKRRQMPGLFFAGVSSSHKTQEHKQEKETNAILAYQDHALKGGRDRDRAMQTWLRGD
ncbi:MAG: PBSX family phage terminase large subunit, partial [Desulfobacterales bacterium]|nr:PBSX family phage terminase large subunit [Desulfobacterales bacterium]